jgi:hypothetical protein
MPFKSKAQRRKFAQLLVDGKITDQQYEEWNRSTGKKELPERLHPAAGAKGKKKTTAKKTTARKKTTAKKQPTDRHKTTARKRTTKKP